jgi:two-component system, LuxR family, response regulator FixJ
VRFAIRPVSKIEPSQFGTWRDVYFVGMIDTRHSAIGEARVSLPAKKSMIYVVDNNYDARTSRFLLETEVSTSSPSQGIALLGSSTRNRADKLAELDGLELALLLRRLAGSRSRTTIILITGLSEREQALPACARCF